MKFYMLTDISTREYNPNKIHKLRLVTELRYIIMSISVATKSAKRL